LIQIFDSLFRCLDDARDERGDGEDEEGEDADHGAGTEGLTTEPRKARQTATGSPKGSQAHQYTEMERVDEPLPFLTADLTLI
jgi:hypothetical protein